MKCGNCGEEFSDDEAISIHGTNRYSNRKHIIAHECPSCGDSLSKQFTRKKNTKLCGCSTLVDTTDGKEICTSCGKVFPLHVEGGIESKWAIPATKSMMLNNSDAYKYWIEGEEEC